MVAPRVAYVNGEWLPIDQARVSVLDRGFLFADGVYEVVAVLDGRLIDGPAHLGRLERSLRELRLQPPIDLERLPDLMHCLVERESLQEGLIYLQITRGADTAREFVFPDHREVPATLVMFAQEKPLRDNPLARRGASAITVPDLRWQRRDIKSIALLAQVLAKQQACERGAFEAWMVEDGFITEGSSSSVGIITAEGVLITRPITEKVLDSITRRAILRLVAELPLRLEERHLTPTECYGAAEAFVASATALILPIVELDGRKIGAGQPGPHVLRLREIYLELSAGGMGIASW